ncbi:MAG: hypothetical protein WC907_01560 [Acholeplasmataceae bacterium]|jgi:hypothetical protein
MESAIPGQMMRHGKETEMAQDNDNIKPQPYHDNNLLLRCTYCRGMAARGDLYGEYFLCSNCADDGDALMKVACLASCVSDGTIRLEDDEIALLLETIDNCLRDEWLSLNNTSLYTVIRDKLKAAGKNDEETT